MPKAAPAPASDKRWPAILGLIALTVLAYLPALGNGFVWDDDTSLTRNAFVQAAGAQGLHDLWLTTRPPDYWPVTSTTFWVGWRLWGMSPMPYHLANLTLHVLTALLLWGILRRLRVPGAWLGAALFALHPVNVESVAWITQRKNLMAMLFYLGSIFLFLKCRQGEPEEVRGPLPGRSEPPRRLPGSAARKGGLMAATPDSASVAREAASSPLPAGIITVNHWYWLSLIALVLAMLSKGSVAILPLVLLGILVWRGAGRVGWKDAAKLVPFFIVAAALAAVNVWFQRHQLSPTDVVRHAGPLERLLGAGAVVWFYLSKAVLPFDLMFVYPKWSIRPSDLLWWLPLLAALAATVLLAWKARLICRRGAEPGAPGWRAALGAWLYFCVALIPVMGFTDVYFMKFSLVADHYQHLALIGVAALAGVGWRRWRERTPAATWAGAAALGLLLVLTWQRCLIFRNSERLFEDSLRKNPGSAMAHNNLGVVLADQRRLTDALDQFQQAVRIEPGYIDAQHNVGLTLARSGRPAEAVPYYLAALRLSPGAADVRVDLGNAFLWTDRPSDAAAQFERAIRLKSSDYEAQANLGIALTRLGREPEALPHFAEAARLAPDNPGVQANLAGALARAGRFAEAAEHYREVLRLRPGDPQAQQALYQAQMAQQGGP